MQQPVGSPPTVGGPFLYDPTALVGHTGTPPVINGAPWPGIPAAHPPHGVPPLVPPAAAPLPLVPGGGPFQTLPAPLYQQQQHHHHHHHFYPPPPLAYPALSPMIAQPIPPVPPSPASTAPSPAVAAAAALPSPSSPQRDDGDGAGGGTKISKAEHENHHSVVEPVPLSAYSALPPPPSLQRPNGASTGAVPPLSPSATATGASNSGVPTPAGGATPAAVSPSVAVTNLDDASTAGKDTALVERQQQQQYQAYLALQQGSSSSSSSSKPLDAVSEPVDASCKGGGTVIQSPSTMSTTTTATAASPSTVADSNTTTSTDGKTVASPAWSSSASSSPSSHQHDKRDRMLPSVMEGVSDPDCVYSIPRSDFIFAPRRTRQPLVLCKAYADNGHCAALAAGTCRLFHASLANAKRYTMHRRATTGTPAEVAAARWASRDEVPYAMCDAAEGETVEVKGTGVGVVRVRDCLLTVAFMPTAALPEDSPPPSPSPTAAAVEAPRLMHCEHWTAKGLCAMGAECKFVHYVAELGGGPPDARPAAVDPQQRKLRRGSNTKAAAAAADASDVRSNGSGSSIVDCVMAHVMDV